MAKQAASLTPNKNTLDVFRKEKAGIGIHDNEGYKQSYYNGSIARPKDMSALKVTSAGINRDSALSAKQMKEQLYTHNYKLGHNKERD